MTFSLHSTSSSSHFLQVRAVNLLYLEWGDPTAPPLLLLHGGSAHAHWWDHIAPALAQEYRVIALDLRGHGDSSWVSPPAYEVEDYVADLEALIAALGLAHLILVGHSLGGFVAMMYATTHASTLRALMVVDIGFRIGGNRFMRLLRQMPSPVYQSEADLLSRFQLLPTKTCAAPVLLQYVARYSVRPREDGCLTLKFDRAALTREPRNLAALLPQITCPTLFVRGSESQNFSASTFAEIVQRCPHARGVKIPGAGHHVFLDNPTAFLDIVGKFSKAVVEDHTCET